MSSLRVDFSKGRRLSLTKRSPSAIPEDRSRLIITAQRIIKEETGYKRRELIDSLVKAEISQEAAETIFNDLVSSGIIEAAINRDIYYLRSSTPF